MSFMNKQAIRTVQKNPTTGGKDVTFVDAQTRQPVTNLNGYQIIETTNTLSLGDLGIDPITPPPAPATQSFAQQYIPEQINGRGDQGQQGGTGASRNASNNFGYIDKPGFMGAVGFIPGAIGLAGKAANAGINANNVAAINQARSMLGLDPMAGLEVAKGIMNDDKGYVGDVNIGKNQYAVGLEALTETGRTTLTPTEARSRANFAQEDITEATPQQVEAKEDAFAQAFGTDENRTGLASAIAEVMSSIFGGEEESGYATGFPDAPAAPNVGNGPDYSGQAAYSGQNKGYDSPGEGAGHFGGMGLGTPGQKSEGLY